MDNYIGEIRIFAGTFAPQGWLDCNGQSLPVNEYEPLFALLGTAYGGDGQNNFNLPDLRSRVVVGMGQGGGLSNYAQGQQAGAEAVTLTSVQLPTHNHPLQGSVQAVTGGSAAGSPNGAYFGDKGTALYVGSTNGPALAPDALAVTLQPAGGSQPHSNIQPSLVVRYIIATEGVYPSAG